MLVKRFVTIFAAAAMTFGLVACGQPQPVYVVEDGEYEDRYEEWDD